MTAFLTLRTRIARHAMEARSLAGELRSFVAAEEQHAEALALRALALRAVEREDEADAVNDQSDALEERTEALRGLRDAMNEAAGSVTDQVAEIDACNDERTTDAARH